MSTISLESLQRAAVQYREELRELPAVALEPFAAALWLNIVRADREIRDILLRRSGGLLRPYKGTVTEIQTETLLKPEESSLKTSLVYMAALDNIQNYQEKDMHVKGGRVIDHKTRKHPYEREILRAMAITFTEDVALAIMHAKTSSKQDNYLSAFDGVNAGIDQLIVGGKIGEKHGNLIKCEEIKAPQNQDDTSPLTLLVQWLRKINHHLRSGEMGLIMPENILQHVMDAYEIKRKSTGEISTNALQEYLRVKAQLGQGFRILTHPGVGTGTRMIATKRGNITVGLATGQTEQFISVRNVKTDPNVVEFWMQTGIGTRIDDWHEKVFATNGGVISPRVSLSGDIHA